MVDPDVQLQRLQALAGRALLADAQRAEDELARYAARRRRGLPVDRGLDRLERTLLASAERVAARNAAAPRCTYPEDLPVSGQRDAVLAALAAHRVLVLTGETGSGKTTQLPKMCWEAGCGRRGLIGMTQPRRVAALSVAARLREEMALGEERIAHAVRFDDRTGDDCLVRVMTDGLLLAEAARDRDLTRYDCLIIDEAHERSLTIDVLLGLVRGLLERRADLRVVVTSATIDVERFAAFFGGAPIIAVGGRSWPVEVIHRPPGDQELAYLGAACQAVREIHADPESGDVLVFLPTERDILEGRKRLEDLRGATVLPCFGRLNAREQTRIFAPVPGRKIVLATNIAETSLTVPGIRWVVDAGLARIRRYAAGARTERLPIEPISQASAAQRAGRAGRLGPGICIRLYDEQDHAARPIFTQPEIQRSNLAGVLLTLADRELGAAEDFPWVDPPSPGAWAQARQLLHELGALERHGDGWRCTATGRRMARLSCDVQIARMLLAGVAGGVAHEVVTIAAFLSVQDPRQRPLGQEAKADAAQAALLHEAGDLLTILQLWDLVRGESSMGALRRRAERDFLSFRRLREWADLRHQLWRQLGDLRELGRLPERPHSPEARPIDAIHKAVLAGMLPHVARWDAKERCYRTPGNRPAWLFPGSALQRTRQDGKRRAGRIDWLVACEQVETSRTWLRLAAPIEVHWIVELAGTRLERRHRDAHFDERQGRVVCLETVIWKGLTLLEARRVAYAPIDGAAATAIFIAEALVADRVPEGIAVLDHNRRQLARCRALVDRLRDPALLPDEQVIAAHYRAAFGDAVVADLPSLRRWIAAHGDAPLRLGAAQLPGMAVPEAEFPDELRLGGRALPLRYRFAPGSREDGVSCELDEADLPLLAACDASRVVPGLLRAQVTALLGGLAKDLRRRLIPLGETVERLVPTLAEDRRPLPQALAALLAEELGCDRREVAFAPLPEELRIRWVVRGADAALVYAGRDAAEALGLAGLRGDPLQAARLAYESEPDTTWPGEALPERLAHGDGWLYPALLRCRDARAAVAVRRSCFATREAALIWHRDGLEALLEAELDAELAQLAEQGRLAGRGEADAASVRELGLELAAARRQLGLALAREALRGDERDPAAWAATLATARARLQAEDGAIDRLLVALGAATRDLDRALRKGVTGLGGLQALATVRADRERLLGPGWSRRLSWPGLLRLPLYVQAATLPLQGQREGQAARRTRLLGAWEELQAQVPPRLIQALGSSGEHRTAATALEDCLLTWRAPRLASGAGLPATPGDGAVLQHCWNLGKAAARAGERDRELLDRLLEWRPVLERQPAGPRRDALLRQLDATLRDHPDLGLGSDLEHQRRGVQGLLEEIRGVLDPAGRRG